MPISSTRSSHSSEKVLTQVPLALKIAVFAMGGLILSGLGIMIIKLISYSQISPHFGELAINLPPGLYVESISLSNSRLLMLTNHHAGKQWLLVRSLKDGSDLGIVKLATSPSQARE